MEGEKQKRVGREERQRRGRSQMYHGWRVPLPRREERERGKKRREREERKEERKKKERRRWREVAAMDKRRAT